MRLARGPGKLSERDVERARTAYYTTEISVTELAQQYGVSISGMSKILRGIVYRRAGGPTAPTTETPGYREGGQ